jgi:hypothetical protein
MIDDGDAVCITDGGKSVSYDNRGLRLAPMILSSASCTTCSDSLSRAEVASSKSRT